MAFSIPTTNEIRAELLSRISSAINQDIPTLEKSFVGTVAGALAMVVTPIYKYATERARQNLALTATLSGLDSIGQNFGVDRNTGTPAIVTVDVTGTDSSTIPITAAWIGDSNNVRYYPEEAHTFSGTTGQINLVASEVGDTGNAVSGDTFTLSIPLSGVDSSATYSAMDTDGADRETDDDYRRRVLDEIRTVGGGGNSADYRRWGGETNGVYRVFPYSGSPEGESEEIGNRTVYVEADTTEANPDGTADNTLKTAVRSSINYDPDTGLERVPLGLTDDTLFVESVTRTGFFVEITNLDASGNEAAVKSDIEDAVDEFLRGATPFITGLDSDIDKNDVISTIAVSEIVQGVLKTNAATAESIVVSESEGGADLGVYTLGQGELAKLDTLTWTTS